MLDVIDVQKQQTCKMTIDQFARSFTDGQDDRVLNCLSFEMSGTPLSEILVPPLVARKLCWVNNVWPSSNTLKSPRPQVIADIQGAFFYSSQSLYKIPYSNFFSPILLLGLGLRQI